MMDGSEICEESDKWHKYQNVLDSDSLIKCESGRTFLNSEINVKGYINPNNLENGNRY